MRPSRSFHGRSPWSDDSVALSLVLDHVGQVPALLRCRAVSKAWRDAVDGADGDGDRWRRVLRERFGLDSRSLLLPGGVQARPSEVLRRTAEELYWRYLRGQDARGPRYEDPSPPTHAAPQSSGRDARPAAGNVAAGAPLAGPSRDRKPAAPPFEDLESRVRWIVADCGGGSQAAVPTPDELALFAGRLLAGMPPSRCSRERRGGSERLSPEFWHLLPEQEVRDEVARALWLWRCHAFGAQTQDPQPSVPVGPSTASACIDSWLDRRSRDNPDLLRAPFAPLADGEAGRGAVPGVYLEAVRQRWASIAAAAVNDALRVAVDLDQLHLALCQLTAFQRTAGMAAQARHTTRVCRQYVSDVLPNWARHDTRGACVKVSEPVRPLELSVLPPCPLIRRTVRKMWDAEVRRREWVAGRTHGHAACRMCGRNRMARQCELRLCGECCARVRGEGRVGGKVVCKRHEMPTWPETLASGPGKRRRIA